MGKIYIHSSLSPLALLDIAAELLKPDAIKGNPLLERWVIQPGRLWERALRRKLADKGIAASLQFGSLRLTLERAFKLGCPDHALMGEEEIFWNILGILLCNRRSPDAIGFMEGTAPAAWLKANDTDPSRARVRLAHMLKGILDDHASYRPQEVMKWLEKPAAASGDQAWIAALARELWADGKAPRPLAMQMPALLTKLGSSDTMPGFPESVVAIISGAQPQAYLEGIGHIAKVCPVHLLILETCERGLSDSMATWDKARRIWRKADSKKGLAAFLRDENWFVSGTLQAYWGELGTSLQQQLVDLEESLQKVNIEMEEKPAGAAFTGDTVLRILQEDIRTTKARRKKEDRLVRKDDDASLVLIDAPSALRELEGARDAIRGALSNHTNLLPSDVVMILTDTERYAPLLPAVFGSDQSQNGPDGVTRIPWHLADRSLQVESDTMAALLEVIAVLDERITLPVLGDLLSQQAIQAKLGFSQDQAAGLIEHLKNAGFRWGLDRTDRYAADQPGKVDGLWTLDFALRRLAAGFAHPDRIKDPVGGFNSVTPLAAFEGSGVSDLAGFIQWADILESARAGFSGERLLDDGASGPDTWLGWIQEWIPQLVETGGEREGQSVWLASVTRSLAEGALRLSKSEKLSAGAFTALLEEALASFEQVLPISKGMGGMTVASPRMARALPASVVVVVGLSDGVWPKQDLARPRGLLADPKAGDRMRREEDRLATLEWVLSAGSMLVWTWQGRDQQNGTKIPASVVVGEMLDVCRTTFTDSAGLVRELSLHAFDEHCFKDSSRSFDRIASAAAKRLQRRSTVQRDIEAPCRPTALPVRTDAWGLPGLFDFVLTGIRPVWTHGQWAKFSTELVRFWGLPCRAFLKAIGVDTEDEYESLPDREEIKLVGLSGWALREELIRDLLASKPVTGIELQKQRAGRLPPGKAGAAAFQECLKKAGDIVASAMKAGGQIRPLSVMTWEPADKLVRVTASKVTGKHLLQARLEQLVLAALHEKPVAFIVIGNEGGGEMPPIQPADALVQLQQLSALAILGMSFPMPYFQGVSSRYEEKKNIVACTDEYWSGTYVGAPESEDSACRIAFRVIDPMDLKLPEPPTPADNWNELLDVSKLNKDEPLFAQVALIVNAFAGEMRKAKQEAAEAKKLKAKQKDVVAAEPAQSVTAPAEAGKTPGLKRKKA